MGASHGYGFGMDNDATTEGPETFTFTIDETGDSVTVTINDTSVPSAGTMNIRSSRRPEVTEGTSNRIDILIETTGYVGQTFNWSLSGITADDLEPDYSMTGSYTVPSDPNVETVILRFKGADGTENETCTFTVAETGASFTFPVIDNPSSL